MGKCLRHALFMPGLSIIIKKGGFMIKTRNKLKSTGSKLLKLCVAFLFPFALFGGIAAANITETYAASADYVKYYQENVSITNPSFEEGSTPYATGNSLSGWSAIETSSSAQGMLIDVGSGSSSDGSENTTFSNYQDVYMLQSNPGSRGDDSRILMINSKHDSDDLNVYASKGYRSNSITLDANSYYIFSVSAKAITNGDDSAYASIYVSGLVDVDGKSIEAGVENIISNEWDEYYIYVATGDESQTVTVDLYLGGNDSMTSTGVVFFDEVNVVRYSQNAFFEACYGNNTPYEDKDTLDDLNNERCYVVDALKDDSALIDTTGFNFDFEDEQSADDKWTRIGNSNGHAVIADIRNIQPSVFTSLTKGYSYVGDDLSYGNSRALILYTGEDGGYVGVESKDFDIKAHGIYKISVNMKVSDTLASGAFYVKVQENDKIYTLYSDLLTDDEENDNSSLQYYALQNGQTSGYSSNVDNNFVNDYQTIELYVKGHSLYDSSINIQLWLGDASTAANGCVVVDNITVEYATNEEYAAASNSVELASFSSSPTSITNSYFNVANNDERALNYPIAASDWTSEIENEKYNESGIVYLYNAEHYKENYAGKYGWAGIYPGHPNNTTNIDLPNNVYMMYNNRNSYQSLTSASYNLASNSYYKLSFDYYNQDISNLNPSEIKVEVIDGNGITLFSQDGIASTGRWNSMNIYFHTAETVSHDIQIVVSLGSEDDKVAGIVYLDNFIVESSSEDEFNSTDAYYKADLTDYYLNLTVNGEVSNEIQTSPAYNLSIDEIYDGNLTDDDKADCANAGIISGKDNPYGEDFILNDSNYLAIQTKYASNATLASVYPLSLTSGSYYKLTFDMATIFNEGAEDASTDEHECAYGASVTIDGYNTITQIVNDGQLHEYTIYLSASADATPTIAFTLVSDCNETLGLALITHIDFTSVEETEFTNASISPVYNERVFVAEASATEDDDTTDDDTTDDDTTEDTTTPSDTTWLAIPSIIFGVAIIVAIIGFALRHVKIKKIERIRKESYDRKLSVNHDAILVEAQKRRDKEVADLMQAKKILEGDRTKLEQDHKEFVKESQLASKGKISRELEKELKAYNLNIIRIDEKINIIKEKIDTVMSADYLLSIERKIVVEEDDAYRKEKKAYKASLKNKDVDNKPSDNGENK